MEYFSVPAIRHYLVVKPERKVVVHHARNEAGDIRTTILREGELNLTPPGLTVAIANLFGSVA